MGFCFISSFLSAHDLIDLSTIPGCKINCVYATALNFTGKQIYAKPVCYLLKKPAEQLKKISAELKKEGLGIIVYDAYRPLQAQQKLWDVCPDERYVSHPEKGGRHTRGTAVDISLYRISDGSLLEMGTAHDDFTEKAWIDCKAISQEAQNNRKKLRSMMVKYGFEPIKTEWWHFDFKGWQQYPVLDIGFETL